MFASEVVEEATPELEIFDRMTNMENADTAIAQYRRRLYEGKSEREAIELSVSYANSFSDLEIKDQ